MNKRTNKTFIVTRPYVSNENNISSLIKETIDRVNEELTLYKEENPTFVELSISDSVSIFSEKHGESSWEVVLSYVTCVRTVLFSSE